MGHKLIQLLLDWAYKKIGVRDGIAKNRIEFLRGDFAIRD